MNSNIVERKCSTCSVCEKEILINRESRSGISILTKVTSYCDTVKSTHCNYALNVSKLIDKDYKSEVGTYGNDTSSILFCMKCHKSCFHCDQKQTNSNNVNVLVCIKCKKNWCYALNNTKRKLLCKKT